MQQHGNCTLCPGGWPSFASAFVKHKLISPVGSKRSEMQQVEIIWFFLWEGFSCRRDFCAQQHSLLFFNTWVGNSYAAPNLPISVLSICSDHLFAPWFGTSTTVLGKPHQNLPASAKILELPLQAIFQLQSGFNSDKVFGCSHLVFVATMALKYLKLGLKYLSLD